MNKKISFILVLLFSTLILSSCKSDIKYQKNKEDKEMSHFIDDLMNKMTIEEKIGQLNMPNIEGAVLTGPAKDTHTGERIRNNQVGAFLNIQDAKKIREVQQLALDNSPNKIPLIFGMDVIHGYKTIFPIPLALAATWDMNCIEEMARISAVEASAMGICWTFSPMIDISRDARWGRVAEGAGEDPYLGSEVAKAYVRGYQGDLTQNTNILACMKHFALYGAPDGGKDYNTVDMSHQRMFNTYLPPFQAAVEEGVGSTMSAFSLVDGIPAAANKWLLTDLLRGQWGFDGFVVADWDAVNELTVHGIGNIQEVSARSLQAGLDMDMASEGLVSTLKKSLEEGRITESDINKACRRILVAKYKLGLFQDPFKYCNETRAAEVLLAPEYKESARKIATESFVLLKNKNNILPLSKGKKIAVIGPLADNKPNMLGTWTVSADLDSPISVIEGLKNAVADKATIRYAKGSNLTYDESLEKRAGHAGKVFIRDGRTDAQLTAEAMSIASNSDVILAVMGEGAEMSGESASRTDLNIPDAQKDLLKKLVASGKPVVLILFSGRPMTITWEDENLDAILNVWFPGIEAGNAIADVLFGDINPSGKTTMTYPRSVGQIPIYYSYMPTGRPAVKEDPMGKYRTGYIDETYEPLYPFGYGLSYTTFTYSDIKLDKETMIAGETIEASIDVTNTGKYEGKEVVQLYIRDLVGSVSRPIKELKAFKKINIKPGETKTIKFNINGEMLKFYNYDLNFVNEPGDFEVMIGTNSRDVKTALFSLKL
ncbi:beta-glucosidase BglX [Parabacteroides sp. Marseille-P3160]|uniref:beta-glucosidase BglX n=1 Tax=Parabacteroides sp. Marseille-P3160 TaxID=1917887 RepID=UPI0009BC0779|nr:beta-glucosidase BglX [Parabacteroides sp. Marseille-P3160]